jgi:hypothetical protein
VTKKGKQTKEKATKEVKTQKDTHGKTVSETAKSVDATVTGKGELVKEVATANRQDKPTKVEAGSTVKGAARVTAGRPASAGRPVKVLKKGGVAAPVKVNTGAKVGAGIKVGKN